MWKYQPTELWQKDQRHYSKKHPDELAAVLRNLERFLGFLAKSKNSRAVAAGFLHPEGNGILAIDQHGGGANLQETRMYVYALDSEETVFLITIGDKQSQPSDIMLAKKFVESLLKRSNQPSQ